MLNPTWTEGDQRGLSGLPGQNADCGQFAAGSAVGAYRVGSIDPQPPHHEQSLDTRTPRYFQPSHGLIGSLFRRAVVPPRAQGVAYQNLTTGAFHYARLERDGRLVQTDANRHAQPGMGGTYMKFRADPNRRPSLAVVAGQRGVQPADTLPDITAFVDYCDHQYDGASGLNQNGFFYFCRFDP